jgi:hypothetical protein
MEAVSPMDVEGEFLKGSVSEILQLSLGAYKNLPGFKTRIPWPATRAGRHMNIKKTRLILIAVFILFKKFEFKPGKLLSFDERFFRNNWILSPLPVAGPGIFPVYNFRGINIGSKQKSRQNIVPGF